MRLRDIRDKRPRVFTKAMLALPRDPFLRSKRLRLDKRAAERYLKDFLETGPAKVATLQTLYTTKKLKIDYSIRSIEPLLRSIADNLRMYRVGEPPERAVKVLDGCHNRMTQDASCLIVKECEEQLQGLGYYYGECFIRSYPFLKWGIDGNTEPSVGRLLEGFEWLPMVSPVWIYVVQIALHMQLNNPKSCIRDRVDICDEEKALREGQA
jgi:hypothetical protein